MIRHHAGQLNRHDQGSSQTLAHQTVTSPPSVSPSRSVEEKTNTGDRSAAAVQINAAIYYGKVETYAGRACALA